MPLAVLYAAYLEDFAKYDYTTGHGPTKLSRQQFGVALRRVFNLPKLWCVTRRVKGKLTRGVMYARGPGAVKTQDRPGRRKGAVPVDGGRGGEGDDDASAD